jgi:catechol 2,3-dioxygenase-like lactoylglutathione lyase family enzyme
MIRRRDLLARLSFLGVVGGGGIAIAPRVRAARLQIPASPLVLSIDGPLIVTGNLARQRELFEGALGLNLVADQELGQGPVAALFGISGRTARTVLLHTRGTSIGVRLVEFRPSSLLAIRERGRPADADALESIGFLASDFQRAGEALSAHGFRFDHRIARYSTPENGRVTEGRFEGPDGVLCTVTQLHDAPLAKHATATDQLFSEIATVSASATDGASALAFYRDTLRLQTARTDENAGEETPLRRVHLSAGATTPEIELNDDGRPGAPVRSLRDRSVLPHRGLQALRFSVPSVDAVAKSAVEAGVEITAPAAETLLFPQGKVRSILIRAPHGVLHHFTETLKA